MRLNIPEPQQRWDKRLWRNSAISQHGAGNFSRENRECSHGHISPSSRCQTPKNQTPRAPSPPGASQRRSHSLNRAKASKKLRKQETKITQTPLSPSYKEGGDLRARGSGMAEPGAVFQAAPGGWSCGSACSAGGCCCHPGATAATPPSGSPGSSNPGPW